ncbi:hypothetical protein ACFY5J_04510 [Peribacillus butanolivorans]
MRELIRPSAEQFVLERRKFVRHPEQFVLERRKFVRHAEQFVLERS